MKKRFFLVVLTLVMTFMACVPAAMAAPRTDVKAAIWSEPSSLCAGFAASTVVSMISGQIFDTLIVRSDDYSTYEPSLATAWEFQNNNLDLVFTLRDDVYFHNGEKVTAEDVAFSFNTIINAGYADCATSAMESMDVIDDTHVVLHFEREYGPALEACATDYMCVFPKAYYEANAETFTRNPMGSGPYKFVEWVAGDKVVLTANDAYWGGTPAIKDVTFRVYTDGAAAAIALQTGELDLLTNPLTTDRQILMDDPNLFYDECESATAAYMFFNMNGPFQNKALREAVFYAIDKEALLLGAIDGVGTVLQTPFITAFPGVDADYKSSRQFDLEKAQAKMIEAGYPDGLDINVVTRSTSNYTRPVEILQNQLGKIGIRISISTLDASAWSAEILRTGNFDLNMMIGTSSFMSLDSKYGQYTTGSGSSSISASSSGSSTK